MSYERALKQFFSQSCCSRGSGEQTDERTSIILEKSGHAALPCAPFPPLKEGQLKAARLHQVSVGQVSEPSQRQCTRVLGFSLHSDGTDPRRVSHSGVTTLKSSSSILTIVGKSASLTSGGSGLALESRCGSPVISAVTKASAPP